MLRRHSRSSHIQSVDKTKLRRLNRNAHGGELVSLAQYLDDEGKETVGGNPESAFPPTHHNEGLFSGGF